MRRKKEVNQKKVLKQLLEYTDGLISLGTEKMALTNELNLLEHSERVQNRSKSTQN